MEETKVKISFILPFYGVERYIGKCLREPDLKFGTGYLDALRNELFGDN